MVKKDKIALQKILKEIEFLETDTKGVTLETFISNERLKRSVSMTLINIGELIHILSKEFKESEKNIPFNEIQATRNIAAHGYHALNFIYIWNTVKIDIPELKIKIEKLL